MIRTYKKVYTDEANVSDRTVTFDLYENGEYVTTTTSDEKAWDWASK